MDSSPHQWSSFVDDQENRCNRDGGSTENSGGSIQLMVIKSDTREKIVHSATAASKLAPRVAHRNANQPSRYAGAGPIKNSWGGRE